MMEKRKIFATICSLATAITLVSITTILFTQPSKLKGNISHYFLKFVDLYFSLVDSEANHVWREWSQCKKGFRRRFKACENEATCEPAFEECLCDEI